MANRNKEIRERATKINNGWSQGAPAVSFGGNTQAAFQADLQAAAADEQVIADVEAQIKMKKAALEERYKKIGDNCIKVRDGAEGDPNFGTNHPIIEAMGFVRLSERKSGLTRKKNQPPPTK